uniref:HD domain-containing protein n=1 Tax=Mycena chlorophos TaxID=658473 RepID=A0ABQ0LLH3_MYCCL|nr:predicted protein [Mycena chlorophos]
MPPPIVPPSILPLIPQHPAASEALGLALEKLTQPVLNHSLRTFIYAQQLTGVQDPHLGTSPVTPELDVLPSEALFVACILHDIGPNKCYDAQPERFEITGADEAAIILRRHGASEAVVRGAWLAAVLHSTPHTPERLGGPTATLRLAIRVEFESFPRPAFRVGDVTSENVESLLPRLGVEKDLSGDVVRQALVNPQKAPPASWPGDLVRGKKANPDWEGLNKEF